MSLHAQVVKLVDTLASGASGLTAVEVQVLSWAPYPYPIVGKIFNPKFVLLLSQEDYSG